MSSINFNTQLISDITHYDTENIIFEQPRIKEGDGQLCYVNIYTKNLDNTIGDLVFAVPENTILGFKANKKGHVVKIRITDEIYAKMKSIIEFTKSHMDKVDSTFIHSLDDMASCLKYTHTKVLHVHPNCKSMIYFEKNGDMVRVSADDIVTTPNNPQLYMIKPVIRLRSITRAGNTTYLNWALYEADVKYYKPLPRLLHPRN